MNRYLRILWKVVQRQHSKGVVIGGNDAEIITSIGIASTRDASAERSIVQVIFGIAAGDKLHPNGKALVVMAAFPRHRHHPRQ